MEATSQLTASGSFKVRDTVSLFQCCLELQLGSRKELKSIGAILAMFTQKTNSASRVKVHRKAQETRSLSAGVEASFVLAAVQCFKYNQRIFKNCPHLNLSLEFRVLNYLITFPK